MRKFYDIAVSLRNYNWPLFLFSIVYYGIMVFLSGYFNVWEDEIYSLNTTSKGLAYAYHQAFYFEGQPPVWFLLFTIWRSVSDSILWARLFSMFLIIISQIFLYRFIRQISDKKLASIFSVLFLLNPWIIYTILEIRLFALVILLSLVIVIFFYRTYYANEIKPAGRILFIFLAITGLFTQYFIGFLLFANAVVLLFRKDKRPLIIYIGDMIIPLITLIIFLPKILMSADVHTAAHQAEATGFVDFFIQATREFVQRTFNYVLPFDYNVSGIWYWTFRGAILVLLFFSLKSAHIRKALNDMSPFILISMVIFLFFYVVRYLFSDIYSSTKYTIIVFIPLFMTLIFLFRKIKPGLFYYWLILLGIVYLTADYNKYNKLYKIRDFPSLAKYIEQNERKGEPVFIYRNIGVQNLEIYYGGINKIFPIPEPFDFEKKFGPGQWTLDEEDIKNLNEQLKPYQSFYVVINNMINLAGFVESKELLLDFLNTDYHLLEEERIKEDILVYKYTRKEDQLNDVP